METITRKSLLYKSGLGFYCINHVQGCAHGCLYPCYAQMMAESHGRIRGYGEWCRPRLVVNAHELLKKELARMRKKPGSVHLCLSTDPFMTGCPEVTEMSLALIGLINSHGIPCSILSKGALPAELADRNRFLSDNLYGISLVSLDEDFRSTWEPHAAPYRERIGALRFLHEKGCHTRVHIEPYPTPNLWIQDLEKLLQSICFVEHLYFGRWNYNPVTRSYPRYREFYQEQSTVVKRFCAKRRIACEGV